MGFLINKKILFIVLFEAKTTSIAGVRVRSQKSRQRFACPVALALAEGLPAGEQQSYSHTSRALVCTRHAPPCAAQLAALPSEMSQPRQS